MEPDHRRFLGVRVAVDRLVAGGSDSRVSVIPMAVVGAVAGEPRVRSAVDHRRDFAAMHVRDSRDGAGVVLSAVAHGHPAHVRAHVCLCVQRVGPVQGLVGPVHPGLKIAAGGIADGRGLAAALALGADGIMMASRFINTIECRCHPRIKEEIIKRQEFETTLYGKTTGLQGRALKNTVVTKILEIEARNGKLEELQPLLSGTRQSSVWEDGDVDAGLIPVGQSIGLIKDIVSCQELLARMVREAEEILAKAQGVFKT